MSSSDAPDSSKRREVSLSSNSYRKYSVGFWTELPRAGGGREVVDGQLGEVEIQGPHALRPVDGEDHRALVQLRSDPLDVDTVSVPELDLAQGHHAGPVIHKGEDRGGRDAAAVQVGLAKLDAAVAQGHPRIDVGRVLAERANNVVAFLPVQALGQQRDAVGGSADDPDRVRFGADQPADHGAQASRHLLGGPAEVRFGGLGINEAQERGSAAFRHRRDPRVVHEDVAASQREQVAGGDGIHQVFSIADVGARPASPRAAA
jgi:hypothetical protein